MMRKSSIPTQGIYMTAYYWGGENGDLRPGNPIIDYYKKTENAVLNSDWIEIKAI